MSSWPPRAPIVGASVPKLRQATCAWIRADWRYRQTRRSRSLCSSTSPSGAEGQTAEIGYEEEPARVRTPLTRAPVRARPSTPDGAAEPEVPQPFDIRRRPKQSTSMASRIRWWRRRRCRPRRADRARRGALEQRERIVEIEPDALGEAMADLVSFDWHAGMTGFELGIGVDRPQTFET